MLMWLRIVTWMALDNQYWTSTIPPRLARKFFTEIPRLGFTNGTPWMNYSIGNHEASFFAACEQFLNNDSCDFTNWKKTGRQKKNHMPANHEAVVAKWLAIDQAWDKQHRSWTNSQTLWWNEPQVFEKPFCNLHSARPSKIIAQRGHEKNRDDSGSISETLCIRGSNKNWKFSYKNMHNGQIFKTKFFKY